MQSLKLWLAVGLMCTAAACRPALPTTSATQAAETPAATSAPESPAATAPAAEGGELVKFSGEADASSEPFHLTQEQPVEISWDYTGAGGFALWLVNDTEDLTDPTLYRILLKEAEGSNAESAQYTLLPGDYHLEVEFSDGPWTVQVKALE